MTENIKWKNDFILSFTKIKWDPAELSLARCLNFSVDEEKGEVTCDIKVTTKKSLLEFFKHCYKALTESPRYAQDRQVLFGRIKNNYSKIEDKFHADILPKLPYNDMLYKHQKEAMLYCYNKRFNLLAMQQGTGKTVVSASLSRLWGCKRTVVVCPSVVKWNWYRDLTETFGFDKTLFSILDASKRKTMKSYVDERFVILNYEMLTKYWDYITKDIVDHIILDEVHAIKSHLTKKHKMVAKLIDMYPEAKVTMLSGTPVKNRVNDIFAYLKISKHPLGKNYSYFLKEYTNTQYGRGGLRVVGSKNLSDLYAKLSNFMVRYRLEDCVDMPGKIINKMYIELGEYKKEYNAVIDEMMAQKEKFDLHGSLSTLNIVVSKSKIPDIHQLVKNIHEDGRKVVIFSSYHAPMDDLELMYGDTCVRVDGKVDAHEKDRRIQLFRNRDDVNVFLGQTVASGVGINLTNCHDIIFANLPFTSTDMEQAISRCYRIGQKQKVNIYLPLAAESIDEYLYDMLVDKSKDINNLVDKGKDVTDYSNIEDRLFRHLLEKHRPKEEPKEYI